MAINSVCVYIATSCTVKTIQDSERKFTNERHNLATATKMLPFIEEQISFSESPMICILNGSSPELNWVAATLKSLDTLCSRKGGVVNFRCLDVLIRTFSCNPSLLPNSESYLSLHSLQLLVDSRSGILITREKPEQCHSCWPIY